MENKMKFVICTNSIARPAKGKLLVYAAQRFK